jgi:MFS transporter, DHA2 family, multidrug resistance protein
MMLVGALIGKIDGRFIITFGFCLLAFGSFDFTDLNMDMAKRNIIAPNVIMGFAMGFIFVPLSAMAMGDLPNTQVGNATGIFNLMRNIGGSFGIAIITTLLSRDAQTNQSMLVAHLNPYNPIFQERLAAAQAMFIGHSGPGLGEQQAYASLYGSLLQQSTLKSYVDNFSLLSVICLLCVPLVLLFKKVKKHKAPAGVH